MDSGAQRIGSGDSQRDGGFRGEGPASAEELAGAEELASAEELAGAEDIACAVAIASVGVNIKTIIRYYNCYA